MRNGLKKKQEQHHHLHNYFESVYSLSSSRTSKSFYFHIKDIHLIRRLLPLSAVEGDGE